MVLKLQISLDVLGFNAIIEIDANREPKIPAFK